MKYTMKRNTSKIQPERRRVFTNQHTLVEPEKGNTIRRLKDGGFISWPDEAPGQQVTESNIDIWVGRTKDGGFIAIPKEN